MDVSSLFRIFLHLENYIPINYLFTQQLTFNYMSTDVTVHTYLNRLPIENRSYNSRYYTPDLT